MFAFITTEGKWLDVEPDQDIAITIDQPFLSSDRMPVPWTTDFNLRLSESTCRIFGYTPAILLPPNNLSVLGTLYLNGIPIMPGKVVVINYTRSSLQVSFKGQDIEDQLTGNLPDLPLMEWNFGKMSDLTNFWDFMQKAVDGLLPEVAAPLILRSDRLDYSQDALNMIFELESVSGGQVSRREYWNSRYANFIGPSQDASNRLSQWIQSGTPYLIPVVRINYLLSVIAGLDTSSAANEYFLQAGIVAPNKDNALISDIAHGGLDQNQSGDYILSLSRALPNVEIASFVKDVLNLFSAAIYLEDRRLVIRMNSEVINDAEHVDWTQKIDDEFECDYADGLEYECGYDDIDAGTSDKEISPDDITEVKSIADIYTMWELSDYDPDKAYVFKIMGTGDLYSVTFSATIGKHPEFSLLRRGGPQSQKTTVVSASGEAPSTFSAKTRIKPVKNTPVYFSRYGYLPGWSIYKAVITDIPEPGGEASEQVVIGILQDRQMVSDGSTIKRGTEIFVKETTAAPLMFKEDGLLYSKYHKPFADFLSRPKSEYKMQLNLSASDIAELKIWRKRLLYNRLFYIKTLEITTNTTTDVIHTEGTFIQS